MELKVHGRGKATARQRGDGLVEFAVVLPVLLLIVIAIFDLGRAIYAYSIVANSAREGARYAIIHKDDYDGITARIHGYAVGLDVSCMTISVTEPTTNTVRVSVGYQFEPITPLAAQAFGGSALLLQSNATMYTGL